MPARVRPVERGRANGRRLANEICREIEVARVERGLSYATLGRSIGLSGQEVGLICRGLVAGVSLIRLAELAAVTGLDLVARTYPGGSPLRDRSHVALLDRLRARLSPSLRWRTEVPVVALPGSLDQRAWDATIAGAAWIIGVEAETHVTDVQALERRLALKQRDGGVSIVLLLLNDTQHHQQLLASMPALAEFATPARAALRALSRGEQPGGSTIVCL